MAFSVSGFLGRFLRPRFYALNSLAVGSEVQVRGYAARKGTREKALKKKRAMKLKKAAQMAQEQRSASKRTLAPDLKKTVESSLSPPPTDLDVYFAKYYKPKEFSVLEAIEFHRENLHPTVLNSEKSLVNAFIELDMTAEKVTKVVNPWKAVIVYPNVFHLGFKKRILVLCQDEYKQRALDFGADHAGGHSLIKLIKMVRQSSFPGSEPPGIDDPCGRPSNIDNDVLRSTFNKSRNFRRVWHSLYNSLEITPNLLGCFKAMCLGSTRIKGKKLSDCKGDFDVTIYDRVIGQMALHEDISLIKAHLKLLYPKPGDGTLTVDFLSAIERFKYGVEYKCNLSLNDRVFGWVEAPVGYTDMEPEKLEQNFQALVANINVKRPKREGDFITHAYCMAPPSRERIKIDFRRYQVDKSLKSSETNKSKDEEKVSAAGA